MPKTQEELNELKVELQSVTEKLNDLSEDELEEVSGGLCSPAVWERLKEEFLKITEKQKEKKESE